MKKLLAMVAGALFARREAREAMLYAALEALDALTDISILSSNVLYEYVFYREMKRAKRNDNDVENNPRALLDMDSCSM